MATRKIHQSQQGYDLYASLYDKKLSYLNSFEQNILLKMVGSVRNQNILDIGCGTGRIIQLLKRQTDSAGAIFTAADVSEEMLKLTKKKFPDVETLQADIKNLPFEDDTFDLVTAAFVIVHLKDLTKAFDEVARVLKPGGSFILTNINQRKAPTIKLNSKEEIAIESFYHIPKHVIKALENSFFKIEQEEFLEEENVWINQIIKAIIGAGRQSRSCTKRPRQGGGAYK